MYNLEALFLDEAFPSVGDQGCRPETRNSPTSCGGIYWKAIIQIFTDNCLFVELMARCH